jgi:hypothetical protein
MQTASLDHAARCNMDLENTLHTPATFTAADDCLVRSARLITRQAGASRLFSSGRTSI